MAKTRYSLAKDVYVRETARHAVFLDLRRNRYTAVDSKVLQGLRASVRGWPSGGAEEARIPSSEDFLENMDALKALLNEGVLTDDDRLGDHDTPAAIEPASVGLYVTLAVFPEVKWRDLWYFTRAWAVSTVIFRLAPLAWSVKRIRNRKARLQLKNSQSGLELVHRILAAYRILQPNFFDAKNACLRDSLTFIEFCALYNVYPTLVFGIRMEPFSAHAWVQDGPMVLNDSLPHVVTFLPILAV
jgi:hypothetical protein